MCLRRYSAPTYNDDDDDDDYDDGGGVAEGDRPTRRWRTKTRDDCYYITAARYK